ncbi:MAG: hypothetical protein DMF60_08955, partial [Acidobacteria bacterium]
MIAKIDSCLGASRAAGPDVGRRESRHAERSREAYGDRLLAIYALAASEKDGYSRRNTVTNS